MKTQWTQTSLLVYDKEGNIICDCNYKAGAENIDLIASAPEMYNHLKDSLIDLHELMEWYKREADSFDNMPQEHRMCLDNAKAVEYRIIQIKEVLAKATGEKELQP